MAQTPQERRRYPRAYARGLTSLRLAHPTEFDGLREARADDWSLASYRGALIDLKGTYEAEFRSLVAEAMADDRVDVLRRAGRRQTS